METDKIVVFRPMRSIAPICFAIAAIVLTIGVIAVMEESIDAFVGSVFLFFGIGFIWVGAHYLVKSTKVGPEGIVEMTLGRIRRYEWIDVFVWQTNERDDGRTVTSQFSGKLFPKSWSDQEVGRPGFDKFLELFRRYAGEKERPGW